jgi:hypothetical protein
MNQSPSFCTKYDRNKRVIAHFCILAIAGKIQNVTDRPLAGRKPIALLAERGGLL